MFPNSLGELRSLGYQGFVTIGWLSQNRSAIDLQKGVYIIFKGKDTAPIFVPVGSGGHFKGKDPNVPIHELLSKWVEGSNVLYIGKASNSLRRRLGSYLKFGMGHAVGHWGGRYIWQLKDSTELVVCWKPLPTEDPREVEARMLREFEREHGKLPYANLVH